MDNNSHTVNGFDFNLINDYFVGLDRQGPGSKEATLKALSFIGKLTDDSKIVDLGCGTGGQTFVLAKNIKGNITALDLYPGSVEKLNTAAMKSGLQDRVKGVVGTMDDLPFKRNDLDLIWSEGAIANIGFEKGINHWRDFLKKDAFLALTYESWFTDERPYEIEKFWVDAVPEMNTIPYNITVFQKAGYQFIAAFTLSETCWTENYFLPQKPIQEAFLKQHVGDKTVENLIASLRHEEELYAKYKQYYGYVFYIGKKM